MSINQEVLLPEKIEQAKGRSSESVFDPSRYFDQWRRELEVSSAARVAEEVSPDDDPCMSIQSLLGSNCEVTFEGVLHFDGPSMGNIRSAGAH